MWLIKIDLVEINYTLCFKQHKYSALIVDPWAARWNERWKPAKQCPRSVLPLALRWYDSPDNGNESGPQWANRSAHFKHPLIYYRHKKSLSSVEIDSRRGQDEETPSGFRGQLTKEHCSKWYHFSIINWPPGRWPCLKPRYSVTYNVG